MSDLSLPRSQTPSWQLYGGKPYLPINLIGDAKALAGGRVIRQVYNKFGAALMRNAYGFAVQEEFFVTETRLFDPVFRVDLWQVQSITKTDQNALVTLQFCVRLHGRVYDPPPGPHTRLYHSICEDAVEKAKKVQSQH